MLALSAPVQRLAVFVYRLRWLNFPATVLLALLQRTPVLRLAAGAGEALALSPLGAVLRSTAATAAALGAVHALAGATQLTASNPSPLNLTAGVAIGQVAMTVTGAQSAPGSFRVTGAIPPGLSLSGLTGAGGTVNVSTMFLSGTPTTAGSYVMSIRAYERANLGGDVSSIFTYTVNVAAGTPANTAPVFTTQPQGATVSAGGSVTFSALAAGTPAPGYQWRLNAIALAGATNPTLTLTNVKAADAGDYTVLATNSAGSAVSATATLAVSAPATAPVFTAQPVSQTIASGSTVVFSAAASGATSWQWQRDGVALAGATSAALVLAGEQARPGAYRVAASNSSGSTMSEAATLTAVASSNFGRLINLSILTAITAPGGSFTMGYVVGGAGTSGAKQLVIRAAGPSLGALGVAGTMADPKIELFAGATPTGSNDDWGGGISLAAALASVGAFPYVSGTSHDAAAVALITSRDNSVRVSGADGGTGTVIAEVYDATLSGAFTAATPRLINVSVNKQIDAGAALTAGFVIGGDTARTVLVRAIGPGLAAFGVGGTIADPRLTLYNAASAVIAENDNWGGDAQLTAAGAGVGAFGIADTASRDAMLLITLAPGNYTAQVSGATGGGTALVEIYEVP